MRCREGGRKLSVDTADGIDRKFCKVDDGGRDDNRNQRSRNLVGDFGQSSMMTMAAAPTAVAVQLMVEIFVA